MKPIGTHTEEIVQVQDPLPTEVVVTESPLSSATARPTSTSTAEASPASTPATETEAPPAAEESPQPETGSGDDDGEEKVGDAQDPGLLGSLVGAVGDAWDWITGHAGKVWNDIVGGS